ncbi:MAG: nuclear transport factor 2 family protein [Acidimicrobiia bacterium]|nr:nuclear transport factor 2 family protein [Acidimicrobiia bacterium]MCY4432850.1 nuclear transport factor 2 family protein [bacterium]
MEPDVQALADERAVINLVSQYCWSLDAKNFEELRNVFTPDAFAILGGTECHGIDAIIKRISSALTRLDVSHHLVGSHMVEVDGDQASHRCYLQAQHVLKGTEGGDLWLVAGTYEDQLVRTPDGWRIKQRILSRVWTEGNPNVAAPDLRPGQHQSGGSK